MRLMEVTKPGSFYLYTYLKKHFGDHLFCEAFSDLPPPLDLGIFIYALVALILSVMA